MDSLPVIVVDTDDNFVGRRKKSYSEGHDIQFTNVTPDFHLHDVIRTSDTTDSSRRRIPRSVPPIIIEQTNSKYKNLEARRSFKKSVGGVVDLIQNNGHEDVKAKCVLGLAREKSQPLRRHMSLDSSSTGHIQFGKNNGLNLNKSLNIVRRRMSGMKAGNDVNAGLLGLLAATRMGSARPRTPRIVEVGSPFEFKRSGTLLPYKLLLDLHVPLQVFSYM